MGHSLSPSYYYCNSVTALIITDDFRVTLLFRKQFHLLDWQSDLVDLLCPACDVNLIGWNVTRSNFLNLSHHVYACYWKNAPSQSCALWYRDSIRCLLLRYSETSPSLKHGLAIIVTVQHLCQHQAGVLTPYVSDPGPKTGAENWMAFIAYYYSFVHHMKRSYAASHANNCHVVTFLPTLKTLANSMTLIYPKFFVHNQSTYPRFFNASIHIKVRALHLFPHPSCDITIINFVIFQGN